MKRIKSVLRSSMAQERMYNLALRNTEQDIVHKMDFTDIIDFIRSCKNQEKTVLSFCSKDLQFWISFSSISVPKKSFSDHFDLNKNIVSNFCDFCVFQSHI